jgi:hypothetical protein
MGMLCCLALLGSAQFSQATPLMVVFDNPTGVLGTSQSYSSGGVTLTAYGYDSHGPSNLYGKADGGDENGIGLANDPHGNHEIVKGSFVQLDISQLLSHGFNTAEIFVGSTQGTDEPWDLFASNTLGIPGTLEIAGSTADFPAGVDISSLLGFHYIAVTAHNSEGVGGQNVLLSAISCGNVPETGSSLALLALALGAVVLLRGYVRPSSSIG